MTVAWMALMVVGLLVFLAAYCWMVVIAFKESVMWGIAALFILPFLMKRWDDSKMAFLGCVAGLALTVFGAVGYSMTSVNVGIEEYADLGEQVAWESPTFQPPTASEPALPENDEPQDFESFPEDDSDPGRVDELMRAAAELDTSDHDDVLTILDEPIQSQAPPRPHRDGVLVPVHELNSRQGERVVIILNSLERVSAYVVGVEGETITLRQRVGGGSVTYTVSLGDIKEVRSRRTP